MGVVSYWERTEASPCCPGGLCRLCCLVALEEILVQNLVNKTFWPTHTHRILRTISISNKIITLVSLMTEKWPRFILKAQMKRLAWQLISTYSYFRTAAQSQICFRLLFSPPTALLAAFSCPRALCCPPFPLAALHCPADELYAQKLKYKAISEELDHALNDMTSL